MKFEREEINFKAWAYNRKPYDTSDEIIDIEGRDRRINEQISTETNFFNKNLDERTNKFISFHNESDHYSRENLIKKTNSNFKQIYFSILIT